MGKSFGRAALTAACACLVAMPVAWADFEVKVPDGRTLLIRDDGTWRAVPVPAAPSAAASAPQGPQAELQLTRRFDSPGGCTFALTLINHLPYEIGSIVPDLAVFRANGVEYASQSISFTAIKSGDQRQRDVYFSGIACPAIARLQVQRGDRCEMGELNRFAEANGQCLARVKVVASELLKFEK